MSRAREQSIKERIRTLSRERDLTFAELWQNLILERFLARLCQSEYKKHFILKGGSLLARYIDLGRETRDLDFLIEHMANAMGSLSKAVDHVCGIDLDDAFSFERVKITPLTHPHMHYTGAQVALLARLGKTKTHVQIDLGFGDIVEPVDHLIDLTSTRKGPLFESQIQLRCYPKEFIFAEKLETVIYRGSANSRMKDFHDLHSLVSLPDCLNATYTEKVVISVFNHRQASIQKLPLHFDAAAKTKLQPLWHNYHQELKPRGSLPPSIGDVVSDINHWLESNTTLCNSTTKTPFQVDDESATYTVICFNFNKRASGDHLKERKFIKMTGKEVNSLNNSGNYWCQTLNSIKYEHNKIYTVLLMHIDGQTRKQYTSHDFLNKNRTKTVIDGRPGKIYEVQGYFLKDWNNRVKPSYHGRTVLQWFQPLEGIPVDTKQKMISFAKSQPTLLP